MFFYGKDAAGHSTGSQTLYIPYVAVAVVVLVLAGVFCFAYIPDIKPRTTTTSTTAPTPPIRTPSGRIRTS